LSGKRQRPNEIAARSIDFELSQGALLARGLPIVCPAVTWSYVGAGWGGIAHIRGSLQDPANSSTGN
jgi:hypothetical protein